MTDLFIKLFEAVLCEDFRVKVEQLKEILFPLKRNKKWLIFSQEVQKVKEVFFPDMNEERVIQGKTT